MSVYKWCNNKCEQNYVVWYDHQFGNLECVSNIVREVVFITGLNKKTHFNGGIDSQLSDLNSRISFTIWGACMAQKIENVT